MFATLDPTTRRSELPGGGEVLFSDTVGFIQKLPTQLVAAFRATLEEIRDASLLLHVVDVSHPNAAAQVEAVNHVLKELGVGALPTVTVWNKVDACADPDAVHAVAAARKDTVCVSGLTGEGLDTFLHVVANRLKDAMIKIHALVPYSQGDLVEEAHRCGVVESAEYTEHGTELIAHVPVSLAGRLEHLKVSSTNRVEMVSGGGGKNSTNKLNGSSSNSSTTNNGRNGATNASVLSEEEEELLEAYYSGE